jgi:ABC-type nickel/cobalt efflux system permease component RcnA
MVSRFKSFGLRVWRPKASISLAGSRRPYSLVLQHTQAETGHRHPYVLNSSHPHHFHEDGHSHADGHHDHDHAPHSHLPPGADGSPVTWRSLLALGVSGGLVPCPSALVVLLGAIALNRIGFGLVFVLAFSLGLAATLTAIGMLFLYAGRLFERFPSQGRVIRFLPVLSALFVSVIGLGIVLKALGEIGIV